MLNNTMMTYDVTFTLTIREHVQRTAYCRAEFGADNYTIIKLPVPITLPEHIKITDGVLQCDITDLYDILGKDDLTTMDTDKDIGWSLFLYCSRHTLHISWSEIVVRDYVFRFKKLEDAILFKLMWK